MAVPVLCHTVAPSVLIVSHPARCHQLTRLYFLHGSDRCLKCLLYFHDYFLSSFHPHVPQHMSSGRLFLWPPLHPHA